MYTSTNGPNGYTLGQLDPVTCEFCPELNIDASTYPGFSMIDVAPLPNGQVVTIASANFITVYDPPSPTPVTLFNSAPGGNFVFTGAVYQSPGSILITGYSFATTSPVVWSYNPITNTLTTVGTLPSSNASLFAPFFWNGVLHAFSTTPTSDNALVTIQLGNPMVLTTLATYPGILCGSPVASIQSGPNAGIYGGILDPSCNGTDLFEISIPSGNTTQICSVPSGIVYGLDAAPAGYPTGSCCLTDAGNILTPNTLLCAGETFDFTPAQSPVLDQGDLLQYVLFTNPSDTAGSIVATSNTPSFAFQPPLLTGVSYYFAAVAGNDQGGNVNLSDPCLDFSNANTVLWRPTPTVSFSTIVPNLCAGACSTVTAVFTGTPPYALTYSTPASSATVIQSVSNSTTFQVCIPAGTGLGDYILTATALNDANCTCD